MATRVGNLRKGKGLGPDGVRVDRATIWGNKFVMADGSHQARSYAIHQYKEWLLSPAQEALRERARRELRGKRLLCWCAPLPCHADTLKWVADSESDSELGIGA